MTIRDKEIVVIGDKEYPLLFDLEAMGLLEDKLNLGVSKILEDFSAIPQMKFLKIGLWVATRHCKEAKHLTIEAIGKTVTPDQVYPHMRALLRALVTATGQKPDALLDPPEEASGPLDASPAPLGTGT